MNQAHASALSHTESPGPERVRVALVEDDLEQRQFIAEQIGMHPGFELVGVYATGEEGVAHLGGLRPAVVLTDIGLPGISGVDLVRELKPAMPETQFMMLTVIEDVPRVFAALEAGATGYLLKRDVSDRLGDALTDLTQGGSPMSSSIARQVVLRFHARPGAASPAAWAGLSGREREIVELLAAGHLYKEIADQLTIGLGTVRTHIRRIYEKLHAHSRFEAVRNAFGGGSRE